MPIRKAAVPLAVAAAVLVGSAGTAMAQKKRPTKKQQQQQEKEKKDREQKEKDDAAAAAASDEEKKKSDAQKKTDEPSTAPAPVEEKQGLDPDAEEAEKAVYISGDLALTRSDLATVIDTTGFDRTAAFGSLYGLSVGLRDKDWRYGIRWRVYDTTEFTLWSFAVQAGYALKMRPVTPILSAHFGYVFAQSLEPGLFRKSLPQGTVVPPNPGMRGVILGGDVSAMYWVTHWFRAGAFFGLDLTFMSREKADPPQSIFGSTPEIAGNPLYTEAGFGLGVSASIGIRATFDIAYQ